MNFLPLKAGSGPRHFTFVEQTSTEEDWPRDFEIDPSGKFVVAANQESGIMVLFSWDKFSVTLIESDITVPYGVCVKFLKY